MRERDDLLRRVLGVPRPELVEVFDAIRVYLGADVEGYAELDPELAERDACLAGMRPASRCKARKCAQTSGTRGRRGLPPRRPARAWTSRRRCSRRQDTYSILQR